MKDYKYSLRYLLDAEAKKDGFSKNNAEDENHGLCDSFIFVSILKPPDGSYSELFMTLDGSTGLELTDRDLFKHFGMLTARLNQSKDLLAWQKFVINAAFELLTKIMQGIH